MADDSEDQLKACEDFQNRVSDLAQAGEDLYRDPHLRTCSTCRTFVVDLEKIAEDARKLLPPKH